MKRIISIILVTSLFFVLTGCNYANNINENSSAKEIIVIKETYKAEANEQTAQAEQLPETEVLPEKDKAVKAEIAKYAETEADFRSNKQVTENGKTFDLKFLKIFRRSKGN